VLVELLLLSYCYEIVRQLIEANRRPCTATGALIADLEAVTRNGVRLAQRSRPLFVPKGDETITEQDTVVHKTRK
jgi:hypothetical protein